MRFKIHIGTVAPSLYTYEKIRLKNNFFYVAYIFFKILIRERLCKIDNEKMWKNYASTHKKPSVSRFFTSLQITSRVFFGEPGPWFSKMQMDGDKTTIFHDIDGSVSEYPGAFLVKEDNWLLRHPDCIDVPDWKAAICSGHYAQVGQYPITHSSSKTQICCLFGFG